MHRAVYWTTSGPKNKKISGILPKSRMKYNLGKEINRFDGIIVKMDTMMGL